MKARLVVCGAAGRMGRRILDLSRDDDRIEIIGAVEQSGHPELGRDVGELAGGAPLGVTLTDDLASVATPDSIALDFTVAAVAIAHAHVAAQTGCGIVIGTSGIEPKEREEIAELASTIRILVAPNTSAGVNVLVQLASEAARLLGDGYDAEIVEIHHRKKIDAPSGTAVALLDSVAVAKGRDPEHDAVHGRRGVTGERTDGEIGVHALRGGDVVGEHTVWLVGAGERIELTHRLQNRDCLASGALRAGVWLAEQTRPGLYTMADALGIR